MQAWILANTYRTIEGPILPSGTSRQVLTGLSSTNGFLQVFPEDTAPFSVTVQTVLNSTAAASTYNVECTLDYSGSSTFISTAATWFSSALSAATSNALTAFAFPVSAIRLNSLTGSSLATITMTVTQAG